MSETASDQPRQVSHSDEEWKAKLGPDRYQVLRRGGTERAFTGMYWDTKTPGVYRCGGCDTELYASDHKFDSGCGWPSFTQPIAEGRVETRPDHSLGMMRTEILCAACGGHLGHVFNDGPAPLGTRHCVNSLSLRLDAED